VPDAKVSRMQQGGACVIDFPNKAEEKKMEANKASDSKYSSVVEAAPKTNKKQPMAPMLKIAQM
jgi:hypothetical protein